MKTKTTKMLKYTIGVASFCLVLAASALLSGFSPVKTKINAETKYAFVTDTERDKAYDTDENNGYVNITTNVVTVNCDASANDIKYQYIDHYNAEETTDNRERAFIGSSGITSVWIYDSYDEAMASRREWLANKGSERKRTIQNFYVTCN
jgi:hypothetical protein